MVPSVRLTLCRSNKLRLTPPEPDFTPRDKSFDDKDATGLRYDLLGRKAVGRRLSDLVERIGEPLVIALDGIWGSGKSHFLRLWTGAHRKEDDGRARVISSMPLNMIILMTRSLALSGRSCKNPQGNRVWDLA